MLRAVTPPWQVFVLVCLTEGAAAGQTGPDSQAHIPPAVEEDGEGVVSCLDEEISEGVRRKGVQKKDFLKRHRIEVSGLGGFYASDVLSSTYAYGGALTFYPSEDFGIEVLLTRSPVEFRLEEPFSAFDRDLRFAPGAAWQGIGSFIWSPIHAKLKFTDATIVHGDMFFVAGAGRTEHASVQGLTWEVGAGLKLYLARFLGVRLDVRDFVIPQEVLGRGRITHNLTILVGLSLWLPNWLSGGGVGDGAGGDT